MSSVAPGGRPSPCDGAPAAPQPAGTLVRSAAPDADVVFVGSGLEDLSSIRDVWRGIPMDAAVVARSWVTPADRVPPPDERERWLYDRWELLDEWIDEVVASQES